MNDNLSAKKVLQEVNSLEGWIKEWENSKSSLEDISVLIELAEAENDTSLQKEIENNLNETLKIYHRLNLKKYVERN